jgi:predicted O-methyltransferase YrrM
MPPRQPPIDFDVLAKSVYAQGAEEAMLQRVFERVAPRRRFCVEFGAGDGLRNSNTARLLREDGWQGVMIEASDYRFAQLRAHWGGDARARIVQAKVLPDTVEGVFEAAGVPDDLDLLSIDIDGNDYHVWRAIERYRPQVVVIEYNPYYEPPKRWVMKYNPEHAWDGTTYYGASLESLAQLGREKGYELLCCDRQGNNAFFVAREHFARFGVEDNRPEVLYRPAMYKVRFLGNNTFVTGHPYRYGPGEAL